MIKLEDMNFNIFVTTQKFNDQKTYLNWIMYQYEKTYKEKLEYAIFKSIISILQDLKHLKYPKSELLNKFPMNIFQEKLFEDLFPMNLFQAKIFKGLKLPN